MKIPPLSNDPFNDLMVLAADLRDKNGGCPWDIEQTHQSLIKNLIEESYETAEAIESLNEKMPESFANLKEELGDLLFQVVIHSQLAAEKQYFNLADVAAGIRDKLIYRHPHVYAQANNVSSSAQVLQNWEQLKAAEKEKKNKRTSLLGDIPKHLPALLKSLKYGEKAARYNFDWDKGLSGTNQLKAKIHEEIEELCDILPENTDAFANENNQKELREQVEGELGDLLFAIAQLARRFHIDPERALNRTNHKFKGRFQFIETQLADKLLRREATIDEMNALWDQAKMKETNL